jgi:DNA-binding NarL/FixJ family response regulator
MSGSIERQTPAEADPDTLSGVIGSTTRVLVADDNPDVLMAIADLIRDVPGTEVVSMTVNVEDTVRSAAWHKPDIAFVDGWLRGGGAETAARRIVAVSPHTMVVALSSAGEPELATRLEEAGGAGCYAKESFSAELPRILAERRRG